MPLPFIADKIYKNKDFTSQVLERAEYDNCTFINCNFEGCFLSAFSFLDCNFEDCNLSNIKVKDATFKDVVFLNSKMLGVLFSDCNQLLFSASFTDCVLNFSSFYKIKLVSGNLKNCICDQVDFTEANFSKTNFDNCDLKNAVFEQTNLEQANLFSAINYSINPERNKIKGAKFSKDQISGLLDTYKIIIS